jgi:hypothetical protein
LARWDEPLVNGAAVLQPRKKLVFVFRVVESAAMIAESVSALHKLVHGFLECQEDPTPGRIDIQIKGRGEDVEPAKLLPFAVATVVRTYEHVFARTSIKTWLILGNGNGHYLLPI